MGEPTCLKITLNKLEWSTNNWTKVVPQGDDNYYEFIQGVLDGLTPLGQKSFQQAIEIDGLLGSQAKTRWAIVGKGAKSTQTQDLFH